ncbi:MAG: bifunctional UDP-2,4-diacetamido-2,4,6-trideoxy-beta-L-altropyranose hydrolase/GNAT family N-acetyltransferase [Halobacteriota archaeon]
MALDIAILTDGNDRVGFGHVTRCLALYDAFEVCGHRPTLVINGDSTVLGLIANKRHVLFAWLANTQKTLRIIDNAAIIVVDSYAPDLSFYKLLSEDSVHIYIDDGNRTEYPKGIVVNGNIASRRLHYPDQKDMTYLLGHQYIILRRAFWNVAAKETKSTIGTILITFGGCDVKNMTPKILRALASSYPEATKRVIVGPGFSNIREIQSAADDKTSLIINPKDTTIREAMQEADVAISAGGQTLNELARMGVPTVAVSVVPNQMSHVQAWNEVGFADCVVWTKDKRTLNSVIHNVDKLRDKNTREERSKIGASCVDGLGAQRVAQFCAASYIADYVNIRTALPKDVIGVYELSNDRDVRENSLNSDSISLGQHTRWFAEKLHDQNSLFMVADLSGELIAQVRLEITNNTANTSLSVKNMYRRFGLGRLLLERAVFNLKTEHNEVDEIKAVIKPENDASIRLFTRFGFKCKRTTTINNKTVLEFFYDLTTARRELTDGI